MIKLFPRLLLLGLLLSPGKSAGQTNTLPNWALGGFVRPPGVNPVILPDSTAVFYDSLLQRNVDWESNDTFNPAAVVKDGKIVVLYRSEDKSGIGIGFRTSRIGYAESKDGTAFTRRRTPVLYPAKDDQQVFEWPGGCEDPRVAVTDDGTYVIFYTQWNRQVPRLGVATSRDLINWTKHGPIFETAYNGRFLNQPHKSASIVTRLVGDKQVVAKINGKYWLYWGEAGVFAATSTNLVDWQPVVDERNELKALISPRKGYFDSGLTECGPPAIITDKGIVLLYNGKNEPGDKGDPRFNANTYSAGQVLFDINDPEKAIARLDVPFLRPMEPFEKSGQYAAGTVFIEGLVFFQKKWYLYYGCADSRVGVAIYDPAHPAQPDPIHN
ncbi:glycoside hydrolase family 130 protein [Chitinophaga sp. MM2321]|uniref:glycoside hydrolase family 130 protein n=1 Tax=Chitinophaga sp. MM2321 TaxID=3137178 RepID=UPI0032D58B88